MSRAARRHAPAAVLGAVLAAGLLPVAAGDDSMTRTVEPVTHPERPLVQSLFDVGGGRVDDALWNLAHLIRRQPDFTLARLVYADLLAVKSGRVDDLGLLDGDEEAEGLRHEARARLSRYLDAPPSSSRPAPLLQLPDGGPATMLIDLQQFRLYVIQNRAGRPTRVGDYYVSIGKGGTDKRQEGDDKTPVGVYRVSSYLPGSRLPDLYGEGAFPINYPNAWDRRQGRTGSGIWIHGTESTRYSRAPLSSRGCVTLSNTDFLQLKRLVEVERTPVIVANGVDWREPEQVEASRRSVAQAVERWRRDWESRDTDRYISHYADSFRSGGMGRAQFAAYKHRVNRAKKYIRVDLSDVAIYDYPGEDGVVLVEFLQSYESDNFRARRQKQQFWRRQGDGWKIILEAKS